MKSFFISKENYEVQSGVQTMKTERDKNKTTVY